MKTRPLHFLVDADGTLLDWGAFFTHVANLEYAHLPRIPRHSEQRSFNLKLNMNEEESAAIDAIMAYPDFYRHLKPLPGAQEAVAKMKERGHHVQVATSPWWDNPTCLQDKAWNIAEHFGDDMRRTMYLGSDKTALRADYLWDDKPEITGWYEPVWTQILYDQPYNQGIDLPRIYHWDTWEEKIEELEERAFREYATML